MKSICGLVKPAGGSVVLDGQRIDGKPAHQGPQSGVAYVPEGRRVFGDMSVADNLKIGAFSKFTTGASKDVPRLLDRVYSLFPVLSERAEQLAGTLSGG